MTLKSNHKVVGALPETLAPNSVYYVRTGLGVDIYTTTATAPVVAHKINTPSLINRHNRFYLYNADERWVTSSDDNYGTSWFQANESCGTGVDPLIEWEHQGEYLRKGTVIKNLHVAGRVNAINNISAIELYAFFRRPNPATRWTTGMDADAEDVVVDLWRGDWMSDPRGEGPHTGALNDFHRRKMDIGYICPEDGYFSICVKPTKTGTVTTTRYFLSQSSLLLDIGGAV